MIPIPTLREELLTRRRQLLRSGVDTGPLRTEIARLLSEVDAALERMDSGAFGLCETCHEPIEADRLLADPLTRFCLDHLTAAEQRGLEQDLELAARVQHALLAPLGAAVEGWEIAHHYRPAGPVSGDYCDLIRGERGDVYFVLGDVAGKGVAAAMLMSHLSATLRTLASVGLPLPEMVERASRVFCESTLPMHYATLVCCRGTASGEIEVCNAGHPPPLLVSAGEVTALGATGVPVGLFCASNFQSVMVRFGPGDVLLLYTDGLIEAENAEGADYGTERLRSLAESTRCSPGALIDACIRDVTTFHGGSRLEDDLTLLAVTRR
ncbi:MAG TPA: SpoIIE family protein phosphatase [Vicinamibacterales bacterium]|jgi:sigma-B regulation protein RsbU (phosphoserine phosphatase)|nr:SpoIIE family protein phosphatase [Vicinamibacterales bacterium]